LLTNTSSKDSLLKSPLNLKAIFLSHFEAKASFQNLLLEVEVSQKRINAAGNLATPSTSSKQ
jgi:hypothetical protein